MKLPETSQHRAKSRQTVALQRENTKLRAERDAARRQLETLQKSTAEALKNARDRADAYQSMVQQLHQNAAELVQTAVDEQKARSTREMGQRFEEIAQLTRAQLDNERRIQELQTLAAKPVQEPPVAPPVNDGAVVPLADVLRAMIPTRDGTTSLSRPQAKRISEMVAALNIVDQQWYKEMNPDVVKSGMDPVLHFVRFGYAEGRAPSARLIEECNPS